MLNNKNSTEHVGLLTLDKTLVFVSHAQKKLFFDFFGCCFISVFFYSEKSKDHHNKFHQSKEVVQCITIFSGQHFISVYRRQPTAVPAEYCFR